MKVKRFYIIAGEASGDLYGSNLVNALKKLDPTIECYGFGGDKMLNAGVELSRDLSKLEIIGFVEVLNKIHVIRRNFSIAKKDIAHIKPDGLILIDYPGFNLRMAKWASKHGIKVFYYIAPQTWAWKEKRIKCIKKYVDHLFVILPFEKDYFVGHGLNSVSFVGHPLVDEISSFTPSLNFIEKNDLDNRRPIVAVLPGSRKAELQKMIPKLTRLAGEMRQVQFVVAAMRELDKNLYESLEQLENVSVVVDQTYDLMSIGDVGIIKSGTSTLEAALFKLPQLVFYQLNPITAMIARKLVKIPYASLPNLILRKGVLKELLQEEFTVENMKLGLSALLQKDNIDSINQAYKEIEIMLKKDKNTADLVASVIVQESGG